MCETYKEDRPLLFEDISDEEVHPGKISPRYHRCYRSPNSGRAKYQAKGAAAIISGWPDHLQTTLLHWWVVIGMIVFLTVIIIYNSVLAFAIIPKEYSKPKLPQRIHNDTSFVQKLPDVFMHIFVQNKDEIDLNKYLPYIEIISNFFPDFNYNVFVVLNDTLKEDLIKHNAEENNDIALNAILRNDELNFKPFSRAKNIIVKHVSLTNYMNSSPLKKQWPKIQPHFVPFLVRAISVWDKGGVSLNPLILTPMSPNPIYMDKIKEILSNFGKRHVEDNLLKDLISYNQSAIRKQNFPKIKVNNIRDVIEALENEDDNKSLGSNSEMNLTEAETMAVKNQNIINGKQKRSTQYSKIDISKLSEHSQFNKANGYEISNKILLLNDSVANKNISHRNWLPFYENFIFRLQNISMGKEHKVKSTPRIQRAIPSETGNRNITSIFKPDLKLDIKNKSILTKRSNLNSAHMASKTKSYENKLMVDLKGNIVATETACHAFIGSIFSNIIHHSEPESLTEFLLTELSIFCKGLMSTCKGVDIILI